ncbi:Crp/Fnr family transcriptional regulator [Emticicia fluvialis]|uniref:Crp/Fnr family transcriptional regulator n=1 Tax=Emticicia fluvialis TaxID=2974474 RepID=UPI002165135E|nr:Crp/Fnr family transcriptional regulator [Emticicia fluvialis]
MSTPLINHIKRFIDLDEYQEQKLLAGIQKQSLKKKEYLLKEGQVCKANYFVEKGCLRIFFIGEKGEEQTTYFAIENWWISDYASLLSQAHSSFYIQAVETTDIVVFPYVHLESLAQDIPQIERYFRILMQKAYGASQQRIKYLYSFSREEMYRHFLKNYPHFVNRIPQYMLASFLGFTPEYLSEIRKKKI